MGIFDLMQGIQQQSESGRKRGLQQLVGQAYGAPQDQRQQILATVAQRGEPGMAYDAQSHFEKMDDNARTRLGQYAAAFAALPAEQKAAAYPQLAEMGRSAGLPVPQGAYQPAYDQGIAQLGQAFGGGGGDDLKSLRIGANGNYWAIRGGQFVDTGTPAAPNTVVRDQPGVPFDILDKRTGGSIYGQQQPQQGPPQGLWAQNGASYQTPSGIVMLDGVAPEDMAAVQADMMANATGDNYQLPPRDVSPQASQAGRPPSRPDPSATITPYQQAQLDAQAQRTQYAQEARDAALAAKREAANAAASVKQQDAQRRQDAAAQSATQLIESIDALTGSPGFKELGTAAGDFKINTPIIRNDAKDANEQLKTVGGKVALATMNQLKTLSAAGATGFGALNASELELLRNALATLQADKISNEQLTKNLGIVRKYMTRIAEWKPQQAGSGQRPQQQSAQQGGASDPLGIL